MTLTVNGNTIDLSPQSTKTGKWKYTYTVESLEPNNEYAYQIDVKGIVLPIDQGKVDNITANYSGWFETKGMAPAENDNNKPIVGE